MSEEINKAESEDVNTQSSDGKSGLPKEIKDDIKKQFKAFEAGYKDFDNKTWDDVLNDWKETFYNKIVGEENKFGIEDWIKQNNNDKKYLPNFLDNDRLFGRARIGNFDQVMIYKYGQRNNSKDNKYIDIYAKKEKGTNAKESDYCFNEENETVKKDFEDKIKALIKDICEAETLDQLVDVEKSDLYKNFTNKQILRKIVVLNSLLDDSPLNYDYQYGFYWVYNDKRINQAIDVFKIKIDEGENSFFKKNNLVFEAVKEIVGLSENQDMSKDDKLKNNLILYKFLNSILDCGVFIDNFSNFNNINVIYNGAPGTGKTYNIVNGINKFKFLKNDIFGDSKFIQFHPNFSYQDFIEGIKPTGIDSNGNLKLEIVNGVFKEFCIKVKEENEKIWCRVKDKIKNESDMHDISNFSDWPHYFFIIDEINRGNLSSILGETFTLLESSYRDYDFNGDYKNKTNLVSTQLSSLIKKMKEENGDDKEKYESLVYKEVDGEVLFGIPFNIHIIGSMNDVDRSIDPFDLALRRRFKWIQKYCDYEVLESNLDDVDGENIDDYMSSCKNLNYFITGVNEIGNTYNGKSLKLGKNFEIGHAFFLKINEILKQIPNNDKKYDRAKEQLFDAYLLGTLKEYIRQVFDENEIDSQINEARKAFGIKEN